MIGSRWVRWSLVGLVAVVSSCGSEDLVDGSFTTAEWAFIQTFRLDQQLPIVCDAEPASCAFTADLGRRLFFDPGLSGAITVSGTSSEGALGAIDDRGKVSCASCHDPKNWFIDTRSKPASSSLGTGWTKRNTPGLVDAVYLDNYTWDGKYSRVGDVLELALTSPAAMHSSLAEAAGYLRANYFVPFGGMTDADVIARASVAFGAYEAQLVAGPSPFDRYAAGEDVPEFTAAARRGLGVFIGRGLCSECHSGPMFSDKRFHNTGIEQRGEHAAPIDHGRANVTSDAGDDGAFRTPTLRHVAKTAPYMHAGQLATLADVIHFYRWGGDAAGFTGTSDPRITPLEIDDGDAADLEAFLRTLTGVPVPAHLTVP